MNELPSRLTTALAGRYRVERELGAGGMATVYLAQDLKHDRKVALKVLKPELAAVLGAERFVVEIKTTASLQHPHILPLFDSGTADGFLYYVMPYIEGETLRDKLTRETQLGIEEAVRITTQVADALDYAHRHGVIHRDIKPENILLHDGRPMVADFGIALAVSAAAGGRMTETGLSLGTPHYMSPEQATAEKEITARSDIYSLGSVLYEMLTGSPPHTGASAQQIIMKIVTDEARPVTELRKSVPAHVAASVAQALEKLPADRFESSARFGEALSNPGFLPLARQSSTASITARAPAGARYVRWGVRVALLAGGAVFGWLARPAARGQPPEVTRFTVPVPQGHVMVENLSPNLAISADGRTLAWLTNDALYKRSLDQDEPERLGEAPAAACCPIFSQDGRWIMFVPNDGRFLPTKAISVDGGLAVAGNTRVRGEDLVFGSFGAGILRRRAGDTVWTYVTAVDSTGREGAHSWPQLLPGGRHLLFTVLGPGMMWNGASVVVQNLATGARVTVAERATYGRYVSSGHIVYATGEGTLEAVPFDLDRQQVTGDPVVVVSGVRVAYWGGAADFAISANGTLAYVRGSTWAVHRLTWVDRAGHVVGRIGEPATFETLSLSPDGRHAVMYVASKSADISRVDLVTGERRRLTFDETTEDNPVWSPDGRRFAYRKIVTGRDHRIYAQEFEGGSDPTLLYASEREALPRGWAPDGKTLAMVVASPLLLVNTESGTVDTVSAHSAREGGQFSPDGRWLAYVSAETGEYEIYVASFPGLGGKQQVSVRGGRYPRWSARSGELFFLQGDTVMVSRVTTGPTFAHSVPGALFVAADHALGGNGFVVSADGQRLLYPAPNPDAAAKEIHVVVNWGEELKARVSQR